MEDLEVRFSRDINCLREKDKNARISSLKRLLASVFKESEENGRILFAGKLKAPLLELLKDPADKCKELTIEILQKLVKAEMVTYEDVPAVVSALHSRLGVDPCQESCEEVRIAELALLQTLLEKYTNCVQPIISEVTDVLSKLGKDRCPQVKLAVSVGIIFITRNGLRFSSKKLLEGVRDNLNHQQYKVRSLTLEAIGSLCLHDSSIADELYVEFKKAQVDRRQEVRLQTYSVIREILLNLKYVDLVKIEGKFVYLLLGGLCDEDCAERVKTWFTEISHRIFSVSKEFAQNDAENFEDDWLVVRNIKALVEISLADIQEWTIQDFYRSRAVNNIKHIVLLSRGKIHPYLETIFKVFFSAYGGSNDPKYSETLENVMFCVAGSCELGVILQAYEKLTQDSISVQEKSAGLKLLSKLVQGLPQDQTFLSQLVDFLFLKDFVSDYSLHTSLFSTVFSIVTYFQSHCSPFVNELFYILLTLENTLKDQTFQCVAMLAEFCGFGQVSELYSLEMPVTLPKIIKNYEKWDSECYERSQFRNLVTRAGAGVQEFWTEILAVLKQNCVRDKDNEVRYDMLATFEALTLCPHMQTLLYDSSDTVLANIITPTCAWKVGASSVQIRISSLVCLNNLLKARLVKPGIVNKQWETFFTAFSGCLDDDWDSELRLGAIQCVMSLVQVYLSDLNEKCLEDVLKETMKRLDDSTDVIRVLSTGPIMEVYVELGNRGKELERVEKDVRVLLLHLDDENGELREGVLRVLESLAGWKRELVVGIVKEKRSKQRNVEIVDKFLMKYGE